MQSGTVVVTKTDGDVTTELDRLKEGDYFGEAALLKNARRGATITALGEVKALSLDRERFGLFLHSL